MNSWNNVVWRRPTIALLVFLFAIAAQATPVDFIFTGSGTNGAVAHAAFTIDGVSLQPGFSTPDAEQILIRFSMTITNVHGGGPSEVAFDRTNLGGCNLLIESNGVVHFIPAGAIEYGPPDEYRSLLSIPSTNYQSLLFFPSSFTPPLDLITWTPAVPVTVPPPPPLFGAADGANLVLSWMVTNYIVETSSDLTSTNWTVVTNEVAFVNGTNSLVLSASQSAQFFRLHTKP